MIEPGLLPARAASAHKGDFGRVFLVAGSKGMHGAAALCVQGCLRTGAGLVTLGLAKSLHDAMVQALPPEAMLKLLPDTKEGSLATGALPEIVTTADKMDAVAIGPGLSQNAQTQELIREIVPKITKPLVLDADALNALAADPGILRKRLLPCILTPHAGEMGRLIRQSADQVQSDRQRIAVEFAKKYKVVVVLKGQGTVVAAYDERVYINDTGNAGMATGGAGDVLTGVIAALLAQKLELFNAARLGVYLHGLAGDVAAAEQGQVGLLASDIADRIPQAIRQYQASPV